MYYNGSCSPTCNSPFIQQNQSGFLTCNLPCPNLEYLYWNSSCLQTCNSPLIPSNQSGLLRCTPPCLAPSYWYWNSSCLSTCNSPFIQQNQSGLQTCNLPCARSLYLYWDNTCISTCSLPFIASNQSDLKICNFSCPRGQYLYWNSSCLSTCDSPYITTSYGPFASCSQPSNKTQVDFSDVKTIVMIKQFADIAMTTTTSIACILGAANPATNTLAGFIKMLPYIRYLKINYPPRLQYMLDNLGNAIISFQFGLPMPADLQNHFTQYALPANFAKYELASSFLVSYWQTLTSMLMLLAVILVLSIITRFVRKYKNWHDLMLRLNLIFRWNFLLMIFATNLDGVALPTSLELRTLHLGATPNNLSFVACLIANIATMAIFVLVVYIIRDLRKHMTSVYSEKTLATQEKKWTNFQLFYKGSRTDSIFRHIFMLPYLLRLYLFYSVVSYFFEHTLSQTIMILSLNVLLLAYMLLIKPFTSTLVHVQHCSDEITMTVVNICVLLLAVCDYNGMTNVIIRTMLGDVIIYANLWFSLTANIFLICYVALGIKSAYQNTKHYGSKGVISWLVIFLSPFEAGGMDVDVMSEHNDSRVSNEGKEELTVPQKARFDLISSHFRKTGQVAPHNYISKRDDEANVVERKPLFQRGIQPILLSPKLQDSSDNQISFKIGGDTPNNLLISPSQNSSSVALHPHDSVLDGLKSNRRSKLVGNSVLSNLTHVNSLVRENRRNLIRGSMLIPHKDARKDNTSNFSRKVENLE